MSQMRVHGNLEYVKRSIDLAREVLRDMKCLEGTEITPCWVYPVGVEQAAIIPQSIRIAALQLTFPGRPRAVTDPQTGLTVMQITECAAYMLRIQNFATGGVYVDDEIKRLVREKTEQYLQQFTVRSGCNSPTDFRLGEWDYA